MWHRIREWFVADAAPVTVRFLPDPAGVEVYPAQGYLRLWLVEGFLARARTWGNNHYPALYGGVSLTFAGAGAVFTTFSRSPDLTTAAHLDVPVTPLLPFAGGTVEVQAALYQTTVAGPLATVTELTGALAGLLAPPLATAAAVAGKVATGLDAVLRSTGDQPVLALHTAMVSPGGGGRTLRPGHLVVVDTSAAPLPGEPVVVDGLLHTDDGTGPRRLTGFDYLVLRVECRTERDDWLFPELDALIRAAGEAFLLGQRETYANKRVEAIVYAWNCLDLTPVDRRRVARLAADEIARAETLGAVPTDRPVLDPVRLPGPDDPEIAGLRLADLLR